MPHVYVQYIRADKHDTTEELTRTLTTRWKWVRVWSGANEIDEEGDIMRKKTSEHMGNGRDPGGVTST
jgi:hypothetical protein